MRALRPALLALAALAAGSAALAATVTVLVKETAVRKRPQFFAPAVATARLGETFEASGPQGGWYGVDGGFIHQSAVTAKKVRLSGSSTGGDATAEEVTLAGKGFNSSVEKSYGSRNAQADFAAVDAMEKRGIGENELRAFLRAGGLLGDEDR